MRTGTYSSRLRTDAFAETHSQHERWLLTYADMITLLAAFFLLLYSMSSISNGKFKQLAQGMKPSETTPESAGSVTLSPLMKKQREDYGQALKNLDKFVEQNRMGGRVVRHSEERGYVISLVSDDLLFERGRADFKNEGVPLLGRVRQILDTMPLNKVQIEGHTDNLPIKTAQFPSNWELSTARASATLRVFTEQFTMSPERFLASGYADTKPLVPNANEVGRSRNRRVDIIILKTDAQRNAELIRKTALEQKNSRDSASEPSTPSTETP